MRTWQLVPNQGGILQECSCEKGTSCPADSMVMMPFKGRYLEKQLKDGIHAFAQEYDLSREKVHYNRLSYLRGEPYAVPRFELFGLWEDEAAITEAQDTFIRLYRR